MKKIIIAEDDPSIQDTTRLILEGYGFEVIIYSNGEALLANDFDVPDMFLLDKQLNGVNGLDVCRFLKSQDLTRDIPVIIFSASPQIHSLAKEAGADGVVEKPFRMEELHKILSSYVNAG